MRHIRPRELPSRIVLVRIRGECNGEHLLRDAFSNRVDKNENHNLPLDKQIDVYTINSGEGRVRANDD